MKINWIVIFLCFCSSAFSQEQKLIPQLEQETKSFHEKCDNLSNPKYYEDWEAFDKKTQKTRKITELAPTELDIFFLYQAESLEIKLNKSLQTWQRAAKNLTATLPDEAQRAVAEAELKTFSEDMLLLRKDLAAKHEELAESLIKKYEKTDIEKELVAYLNKIKKTHDKDSLVNRENK